MAKQQPLPERNKALEELVKKGEFAEAILTAWGLTEYLMDDVLLKEYQLSGRDYRAEPILRLNFDRKLQFQKEAGVLSSEEFDRLRAFQVRRNNLFHKDGLWITHIAESEKQELAEIAIKAVQVIEGLESRVSSPSFREWSWHEEVHPSEVNKEKKEP